MAFSLDSIIDESQINPYRIKNVYIFGSQVYGTAQKDSDVDVKMIANNSVPEIELNCGRYNIHVITPDEFRNKLKQHHIGSIECLMADENFRLKEEIDWQFKLNIVSLRHSVAHTASNSWVKCRKKLEFGEYYIGIKSMFHSLRIVDFGIQIARHGKIVDYSSMNYIWNQLNGKTWTWEELDKTFREIRNTNNTLFRNLTTKE